MSLTERRNLKYRPRQPSFEKSLSTYTEFIEPVPSFLSGGIQYYGYHLDALNINRIFVLPDGCVDIVICCYPNRPSGNICGSIVRRRQGIFVRSDCDYFTIRFLPGYAEQFLKFPVSEFTENEIPVQNVLPHAAELLEMIASQLTFKDRIHAFENFCRQYYREQLEVPNLVQYLTDKILASQGTVQIGELSAETGYSTRYMHKTFERYVGVSPKLFSRIIRFQHVLKALEDPSKEKTFGRILELGYFDQNHFIKEFKEFSAVTPKKYIQQSSGQLLF
ncbi:Helix-turn-helix domain-containing protein [Paenibacillus sophorae]|uniref:Helix-turn-helix domain-containing protein n=1 Tax=Paenibacillus sophorae TaxID=1333845 RepID=A0A1H8M9Y9_9BACL|nr:helix-turn-helix transcriptional regulator [Paenibacillus sophorae]QWU17724.1 helix-turn-helix domain-containing protein [Paenibacillus sophorae]SEO13956.1 Helix-turn-helix domain-containing protein [Paenibacillus sophorae]